MNRQVVIGRIRAAFSLADRPVRILLILCMGYAAVTALAYDRPQRTSSIERLYDDLDHHRVDHLELVTVDFKASRETNIFGFRWSTSRLTWWEFRGRLSRAQLAEARRWPSLIRVVTGDHGGPGFDEWLDPEVDLRVSGGDLSRADSRSLSDRLPEGRLRLLISIIGLGTFVLMLSRPDHHYANRWAWFWLMTTGLSGAVLYLLLERRPAWRSLDRPLRDPAKRLTGGWGFVCSLFLAPLSIGLASVVFSLL
ncbi:hypothetical protein EDD29_8370 [Actinocorallia herbida]|uniref:Uncharacterized protein n=1 Tax=Actinocorallia herbida TaxID=58109 RepID=A0A3N1DAT7_9ACTN|nr:hypothetical protein [Actinocorallia herbida]ROO90637.1 hypothetical protein EDD29_8370 [Actinocorallia herbida]